MVVSLGPGKFYGTSLPRPRLYTDVKFNDHRVDPPVPVTDPLMSWAQEAHWSMGGLSFNRLRLQGKIEGNVERLRSQREKLSEAQAQSPLPPARSDLRGSKRTASPSPPPAPVATKRKRFMTLIEEEEDEEEKEEEKEETVKAASGGVRKRRLVKKLGDDFDRVALESEGSETMSLRTRSRRLVKKVVEEAEKPDLKGKNESGKSAVSGNGVRASPRLAKRGSN